MVASASDGLDFRAATVAGALEQRRRRTGWRLVVALYRRDVLGMVGLSILIAIAALGLLAPVIADYPGADGDYDAINLAPTRSHLFGTDELGRDILAQTVWGARSSFYVAAFATLIATGLGIVVGLLSGYFPGLGGDLFTGIIDVFLTL